MSADSPRRTGDNVKQSRGIIVTPQMVSDRSILDSAIGFINEVTLAHPIQTDTKNKIAWARFETAADISDPRFSDDWESESDNGSGITGGGHLVVPPLLLILGYNVGAQVWAIPNNGEAVEVLSWRHGIITSLRILPTPSLPITVDEHERADESLDAFADQRPLMALVENNNGNCSTTSASPSQFCAVNFISLKTGTQVKTLKYKNAVIDILVNRSSIVITFHECLAILDANTLEDRWSINTCYPSPGINPNPVALGARWLAYAEHKLFNSKRSGGGWDGEALASYTSTVLNAAKSLGKGLRDLGGQVAAGLTGSSTGTPKSNFSDTQSGDCKQPGVITIIDTMEKRKILQYDCSGGSNAGNTSSSKSSCSNDIEADSPAKIVHFIAHSEPIAAMEFDYSGMLLLTADRRGHDFHVFRIQPHPISSALSAVHHLYVLHRGDTSAKVQNITFSLDSRWVAVSTLRGTTHVFPIAPYGGIIGARSHGSYRVVNQMSNYLRSAGLPADERSDSPVAHTESTYPYPNRTMPPFPRPLVIAPLAQLRQPFTLDSPPRSVSVGSSGNTSNIGTHRQRLSSLSDDNGKPLSVCAIFAASRSCLLDPPNVDETTQRIQRKALDSLFIMAGHGALIQYDLDTKVPSTVSKEWNDAPIELVVEAKAQWNLAQRKEGPQEVLPPLSSDNWLLRNREPVLMLESRLSDQNADSESSSEDEAEDRREPWLSQVERTTYMGPGRRLWMGPQFSFWTYEEPSGSNSGDKECVDIDKCDIKQTSTTAALTAIGSIMEGRSSPLNMSGNRASPLQMTACSWSSLEPSPKLERSRHDSDSSVSETSAFLRNNARIKEEMAEAMKEASSNALQGGQNSVTSECYTAITITDNAPFYDALTDNNDDIEEQEYIDEVAATAAHKASIAALANALPNIHSYESPIQHHQPQQQQQQQQPVVCESNNELNFSIEKIINPLGIVTTVTRCSNNESIKTDKLDEVVSQLVGEETIIRENYDERLFRPVVTIFYDEKKMLQKLDNKTQGNTNGGNQDIHMDNIVCKPSELITNKLIVPVLAKEMDEELNKREKQKRKSLKVMLPTEQKQHHQKQQGFEELSGFNKKPKTDRKMSENKTEEQQTEITQSCESGFTNVPLQESIQNYTYDVIDKVDKIDKLEEIDIDISHHTYVDKRNFTTFVNAKEEPIYCSNNINASIQNIMSKNVPLSNNLDNDKDNDIISPITDNHLNVKDLADSLIEISNDKKLEVSKIVNIVPQALQPPVDIYGCSPKPTKKRNKKKKCQFSNSSSETEEFIDVTKNNLHVNNELTTSGVGNLNMENANPNNIISKSALEFQKHNEGKEIEVENTNIKGDRNENSQNNEEIKNTSANSEKNDESKDQDIYQISENIQQVDKSNMIEVKEKNEENSITKSLELRPSNVSLNKIAIQVSCNQDEDYDKNINMKEAMETVKLNKHHSAKTLKSIKNPSKIKSTLSCNKTSKSDSECCQKSKHADVIDGIKTKENFIPKTSGTEIGPTELGRDKHINFFESITEKKDNHNLSKVKVKKDKTKKLNKDEFDKNQKHKDVQLVKESLEKDEVCESDVKVIGKNDSPPSKKKDKETCKSLNVRPKEEKQGNLQSHFILPIELEQPLEEIKIEIEVDARKETTIENCTNKIKKNNNKEISRTTTPSSVIWQPLRGTELISKSLNDNDSANTFQTLKEFPKHSYSEKLLPELLPTFRDLNLSEKDSDQSQQKLVDFTNLESLPQLPALQPLELLMKETKFPPGLKEISLINFESPSNENLIEIDEQSKQQQQQQQQQDHDGITPSGLNASDIIQVLQGSSLHYENEQYQRQKQQKQQQLYNMSPEKVDISPTLSSSIRSFSALEDASIADCKSLTENDETFMSLEKYSSSPNSSVSEEQKKTRKQKRRKQQEQNNNKRYERHIHHRHYHQQSQQNLHKQLQPQQHYHNDNAANTDDEELRPLIAEMTTSQNELNPKLLDAVTTHAAVNDDNDDDDEDYDDNEIKQSLALKCPTPNFMQSTTDSDGPVPTTTTTTSDDNIIALSAVATAGNKIKTKKLEHKINLIAAIEAATSSSSSSAEESGIEIGGRRCLSPNNNDFLVPIHGGIATVAVPTAARTTISLTTPTTALPIEGMQSSFVPSPSTSSIALITTATMAAQSGVIKKKTKRRRR